MMTTFEQNTRIKPYLTKIPLRALKVIDLEIYVIFREGREGGYLNATSWALGSCMWLFNVFVGGFFL